MAKEAELDEDTFEEAERLVKKLEVKGGAAKEKGSLQARANRKALQAEGQVAKKAKARKRSDEKAAGVKSAAKDNLEGAVVADLAAAGAAVNPLAQKLRLHLLTLATGTLGRSAVQERGVAKPEKVVVEKLRPLKKTEQLRLLPLPENTWRVWLKVADKEVEIGKFQWRDQRWHLLKN